VLRSTSSTVPCSGPRFVLTRSSAATAACGTSSSRDQTELRTIAIPYAALKGVYQIRQWDSRPAGERDEHAELDQLARILAEREGNLAGGGPAPLLRPVLSRIRRPPGSA